MGMGRVWDGYGTGMGQVWDGYGTGRGARQQTTPEVQQMQQSLGLDEFIECWLFDFSENLKVEPFDKTNSDCSTYVYN